MPRSTRAPLQQDRGTVGPWDRGTRCRTAAERPVPASSAVPRLHRSSRDRRTDERFLGDRRVVPRHRRARRPGGRLTPPPRPLWRRLARGIGRCRRMIRHIRQQPDRPCGSPIRPPSRRDGPVHRGVSGSRAPLYRRATRPPFVKLRAKARSAIDSPVLCPAPAPSKRCPTRPSWRHSGTISDTITLRIRGRARQVRPAWLVVDGAADPATAIAGRPDKHPTGSFASAVLPVARP